MNSGGSPSGESAPPTLPTSRMKKTTACTRCVRPSLPASSGRIRSIDAPVVPITLASAAPTREQRGVARRRARDVTVDADSTRDRDTGEQHDDERNVFEQDRVDDLVPGLADAEGAARAERRERATRRARTCRSGRARTWRRSAGRCAIDSSRPGEGEGPEERKARAVESGRICGRSCCDWRETKRREPHGARGEQGAARCAPSSQS